MGTASQLHSLVKLSEANLRTFQLRAFANRTVLEMVNQQWSPNPPKAPRKFPALTIARASGWASQVAFADALQSTGAGRNGCVGTLWTGRAVCFIHIVPVEPTGASCKRYTTGNPNQPIKSRRATGSMICWLHHDIQFVGLQTDDTSMLQKCQRYFSSKGRMCHCV